MSEKQTLQDAFPEMTSFEWLETAYRNARKQKRYRDEILAFSNDLDANLLEIQEQMRAGTFHFGPYRRYWVYIPKKRLVMALPFSSRIVQWSVYQELNPFYDRMMIEDSYACRKDKGSLAAAKKLQHWMRIADGKPGQWYVLKLDISKYFYRVDHEILLQVLGERIKDPQLMDLLQNIINCDGERFGLPRFMGPDDVDDDEWLDGIGMPIGNLTSQLFANIYLDQLDQFCKHQLGIKRYIRYMDDIIILAPDKETANRWKDEIGQFLQERLHLDLNRKTAVRPADRIEFVGYIVTAKNLKLRKATTRRIKSAFRGICRKYFAGEMTRAEFDRRVASYKGMIQHCKADNLKARLNEIYIHAKGREAMSNLKIIEELCGICSDLAQIIAKQHTALAQLDALVAEEEIAKAKERYTALIGADEWPDDIEKEVEEP